MFRTSSIRPVLQVLFWSFSKIQSNTQNTLTLFVSV